MIKVNKTYSKEIIKEIAQQKINEIQNMANKGQEYFRIQYSCISYSDGGDVLNIIEKEGVECCERGFGSSRNMDGSYNFDVKLKMNEYDY